jgi:hypothetical protein
MPEDFTLPEPKEVPKETPKVEPKEELKKEPDYKVVECKSQAEWDFVTKKIGYIWNTPRFDDCNENCINFQRKSRGTLGFYKRQNSLIYSFDEWCKEFNHTFDEFEGVEYVELLTNSFGFKRGDIAKIFNDSHNFEVFVPNRVSSSAYSPNVLYVRDNLKPSTKAAYDKQHATVTLDTSGGMIGLNKETPKSVDFKVGDWVTFEVDKCVGNLSYCKTEAWNRNMTLKIEGFNGWNPSFSNEQIQKRYPHYNWAKVPDLVTSAANNRSLFRHAYSWEIPSESTTDTTYELKSTGAEISTVKTYQLFIEKTQAKPVVADKPINLIKTRKLQINLVD